MPVLTFLLDRLDTPTGRILIVTDDQGCLRAIDWEDHEPRMQALLKRHYGACRFRLREIRQPSMARRSLHAYFEGNLEALTDQPTATMARISNAWSGTRYAASLSGTPSATAPWQPRLDGPRPRAPSGLPTAPTLFRSSFPAIG